MKQPSCDGCARKKALTGGKASEPAPGCRILAGGMGEGEVLLMTKGVTETDNPSHSLSQKAWRKVKPFH